MTVNEMLFWLEAKPFVPFKIVMNSGETREVAHPELVTLMRRGFVLWTPSTIAGVQDRGEMLGLGLIERIEPSHIETPHGEE